MQTDFSQADLEGYLDEALPAEKMAAIEAELRRRPQFAADLAAVLARRDAGVHSLGDIWRRHRLSCPTRRELGSFLLGILPREAAGYLRFHLETAGCRYCQASLSDLETQNAETGETIGTRRRKYFQSSAGLLKKA